MKILPIGKQNFASIIQRDMLYVDKTQAIHRMITQGDLYFLARPRRFGKTLLVSTLEYIFSGQRALFQDLYIGQETDYDWENYPVLTFSFNSYGHKVTNLRTAISRELEKYAQQYDLNIGDFSITEQFKNLVTGIAERGRPVVILIDEYDKPIVDFITDIAAARENQTVLKDFFSPLKGLDRAGHLRFLFITGISKFSKVSLFSDLNNLVDLSPSKLAADITGITSTEMLEYFSAHIERAAQRTNRTTDDLLMGVKLWYNGYSFDGETRVYNPFSLLNFFSEGRFRNFWFATGTPTFLVELIRKQRFDPEELEAFKVGEVFFDRFSLERLDIKGLLFQTGYLTIKEVIKRKYQDDYILGYPNVEVRKSFMHNLLESFTFQSDSIVSNALLNMRDGLEAGNLELFVKQLKVLLSDLSYFHIPRRRKRIKATTSKTDAFAVWEGYFHTIVYLITAFLGLEVKTEVAKHKGHLDLLAETDDYLYLMEFKLDESGTDALQQIKNRDYIAAYLNTPKTLFLVGVNFSRVERNVESWEFEKVTKLK